MPGATSDLQGLVVYDTDANGFFDAGDARFGEFTIWRDANQDGVSQAGELRSLADWNISAVNLTGIASGQSTAGAGDNVVRVLPPADAGNQPLPYLGPDVRLAVCRYDVSDGPVSVTVALPDKGWTLGLYSTLGDNFYVMPAQQLRRSEVTFVIVPGGEKVLDFGASTRRPTGDETQVDSPTAEGLVLVRAPLRGLSWRGETEAKLRRASCAPVPQRR